MFDFLIEEIRLCAEDAVPDTHSPDKTTRKKARLKVWARAKGIKHPKRTGGESKPRDSYGERKKESDKKEWGHPAVFPIDDFEAKEGVDMFGSTVDEIRYSVSENVNDSTHGGSGGYHPQDPRGFTGKAKANADKKQAAVDKQQDAAVRKISQDKAAKAPFKKNKLTLGRRLMGDSVEFDEGSGSRESKDKRQMAYIQKMRKRMGLGKDLGGGDEEPEGADDRGLLKSLHRGGSQPFGQGRGKLPADR
jgi:hypothetical protein